MITVLQYAPGFLTGGIESRMLDWYRNIDKTKVRFILIKLNDIDNTDNVREFLRLGGKLYNLPPLSVKTVFNFSRRINHILIKENVNIVHVHDVNSGFFVLRAAKKTGIRCRILHSRTTSDLPNEKNVLIKNLLRKLAPKYANHFFACSVEAGIWGIGEKYKEKTRVIKNGIQIDKFVFDLKIRNMIREELQLGENKIIGTVCRLSPQKNIPFLLDIFEQLHSMDKSYRLVIVGDGDRSILEKYYSGHPISEYVIVTGAKKNVWDYYMAFDVFCGTSLYEGFGTTAIEAQASGLPTIISEAFPATVVVTNNIWRLPIGNSSNWVNEIKKHIGNREPASGIKGVTKFGYNANVVAKELEAFYLENAF